MRTLLLLILVTLQVGAATIIIPGPVTHSGVISATCASTDTIIPHSKFLEGFETATTGWENNGWTTNGSVAYLVVPADSSALTSGKPTGACNQAMSLDVNSCGGTETWAMYDIGSSLAWPIDLTCYFYMVAGPASGKAYYIVYAGNNTNPGTSICFKILLNNNAGTIEVRAEGNASNSSYFTVTTGTWHKLHTHIESGNSSFDVDDTGASAFNAYGNLIRYIHIGAPSSLDAGDNGDLWFDLICVN